LTGLSVRLRLAVLVGGLLLSFLMVASSAIWLPQQVQTLLRSVYADRVVPLAQLKDVSDAYAVTVVDALHKYRDGALDARAAAAQTDEAVRLAERRWRDYRQAELSAREARLVAQTEPALKRAEAAARQLLQWMENEDRLTLNAFAKHELYPIMDPLTQSLQTLINLQEEVARDEYVRSIEVIEAGQRMIALLACLVLGLGAWAGLRIARSVTAPLEKAVKLAEAVAAGALQTPIEARGPQEVGQMLQAVERMRAALVERADRDPLTGLLSRRRFDELLLAEYERCVRTRASFAVLLIDLDHFKRVNDDHGHAEGDRVLQAAATGLAGAVRSIDHAGRYGGEEFAVLLPGAEAGPAGAVAERVRQAVRTATLGLAGRADGVTASIGVAAWSPVSAVEPSALLGLADKALYEAKRSGRDRVVPAAGEPSFDRRSDQAVEQPD
jgi:diguanylate cyclase (GGDEF)-like protein